MFTFHLNGSEASLQNRQYGLLHQLLEADPVLWILNVCLQKSKKELATLPQRVFYKSPNDLPDGLLNQSRITQKGQNEVYFTSKKGDTRLPYGIATTLRGLSPLSDAILLQRPYTDPEVQIEMDILLGEDRESAWEFIEEWRTAAIQSLILYFSFWLSLEKGVYRDKSYWELEPEIGEL
ncbi:hypothetical protein MferCBS49748_004185 [Microsporum ferrugineum]